MLKFIRHNILNKIRYLRAYRDARKVAIRTQYDALPAIFQDVFSSTSMFANRQTDRPLLNENHNITIRTTWINENIIHISYNMINKTYRDEDMRINNVFFPPFSGMCSDINEYVFTNNK